MKNKAFFRILAVSAAMLLASFSCQKPATEIPQEQPGENNEENNGETPEAVLKPNTYEINGTISEYGSVSAGMFESFLGICGSPKSGKETFEDILGEEEIVYILITAPLNGQEFDITTETKLFTIYISLGDKHYEVAPGSTEGITAGKCRFNSADGKVELSVEMTMADGTTFSTLMSDEKELAVNTNTLIRNGEVKALNASFFLVEDGLTSLYFTPADVDYFDEMIDKATWYTYIMLDDAKCNGTDINAADLFMSGIGDNLDGNAGVTSLEVKPTGTVNVKQNGEEGSYTVAADLTFGKQTIQISFNGKAESAKTVPVRANEYTYNGTATEITGAVLEKGENTWTVTLTAKSGENVAITMPQTFFIGQAHGFSQSADFQVTLGTRTFSKANKDSGTATVGIDETTKTLTAEFMDYKSLNVYYSGTYTTK